MSHFTVMVILPKEGLEKLDANTHEGEDEWHNAYNHQWYHPELEQALAPYNEQPEEDSEYLETTYELNKTATAVMNAYHKKDWDTLSSEFNQVKSRFEDWQREVTILDENAGGRKLTESEIATKLEPFDELYEYFATEKFEFNDRAWELFTELFGNSYEMTYDNETKEVNDTWKSNPYAKWDWWVVGGRWRNMGDNGLFEDLSVFLEEEQVPYWKEELGYKLYDIRRELDLDFKNMSDEEYDKVITDYIKNNKIVRFYDTETKEPREYYETDDLLTMVTRKKESVWAMLFPEEGWIEAGEMGWFGMSSLDMLDLGETEQALGDQYALTDNLLEKYKETHIGLVVDCHI